MNATTTTATHPTTAPLPPESDAECPCGAHCSARAARFSLDIQRDEFTRSMVADQALRLVVGWTGDDASQADEFLIEHAVRTTLAVHREAARVLNEEAKP